MGNILIADDEMKMRRLIREYLVSEGFTCFEAENGSEALEKFSERDYQAVILDVMMPQVDGWTVLREIRKESSVPVIMLTARGEEYDRLFGFELDHGRQRWTLICSSGTFLGGKSCKGSCQA